MSRKGRRLLADFLIEHGMQITICPIQAETFGDRYMAFISTPDYEAHKVAPPNKLRWTHKDLPLNFQGYGVTIEEAVRNAASAIPEEIEPGDLYIEFPKRGLFS